jgi:hypothetical protein
MTYHAVSKQVSPHCISLLGGDAAYKIQSTGSPVYLLPAVNEYMLFRHLRSSSQSTFLVNVATPVRQTVWHHNGEHGLWQGYN